MTLTLLEQLSIKHIKFELFLLGIYFYHVIIHFEQSLDAFTADHNGDLLEFPESCWKLSRLIRAIVSSIFFFSQTSDILC